MRHAVNFDFVGTLNSHPARRLNPQFAQRSGWEALRMGTLLAFMMSVVALSLPELILLRRVLKPQLLAAFVAVVATGIIAVGHLFNAILA